MNQAKPILNDEQNQAATHIDGPLLVVAGPGTGKTQLLSARVAHILEVTDTDPAEILCLTFTNKAAVNMKERLMSTIGVRAKDVFVRTFHSFAAEVMNLYPDYFWNGTRLSTAPDALQASIISSILEELDHKHPLALKFGGQFSLAKDIANSLKLVKDAGLTPDGLRALLNLNLAYIDSIEDSVVDALEQRISAKTIEELRQKIDAIPDQGLSENMAPLLSLSTIIKESLAAAIDQDSLAGNNKNLSKWKSRWVQTEAGNKGMHSERRRNQWWLGLAEVYESYRDKLHQCGHYDYSDMLVEVISKLQQNPEIRADLQERFSFVLIDEFQDTNAAQARLAHLVADHHSANSKPNIMAVGDDDQTIYKFNGAELNNMLSFKRSYPSCKIIVLKQNYRSNQAILDASKTIISEATDRLVNRMPGLNKDLVAREDAKAGVIEHRIYPSREHQYSNLAKQIPAVFSAGNSVAVLARSHDSLQRLASILNQTGTPIRYERQQNIIDHQAVRLVRQLSTIAVAIAKGNSQLVDAQLAKCLPHPAWGIDPSDLWQLAVSCYSGKSWLDSIIRHKDRKLSSLGNWIMALSQASAYEPAAVMIEYMLGLKPIGGFTSPIKEHFMSDKSQYLQAASAIQLLRAMATEMSGNFAASLEDFVGLIDITEASGQTLSDESTFVSAPNSVHLLTVHKAKGLEFDSVFIIDCVEDQWQPRKGGRQSPANLPLKPHGDDADDYARLSFVAATRAKTNLVATSFRQDSAGQAVLASPLIYGLPVVEVSAQDAGDLIEVLEQNMIWPRLTQADEQETLKARLGEFELSVTSLINFLDVSSGGPQNFLERNILRLPEAKSVQMARGTAVHAALEFALVKTNHNEFTLQATLKEFERALGLERLSPADFKKALARGQDKLTNLFTDLNYKLPSGSLAEQNISGIKIGTAKIKGKLDRIDSQTGKEVVIVDYKTGKPLSSFSSKNKTEQIKQWKLRTQLIFYALLAKNSPRFKNAKTFIGQMVFVDAETQKDLIRDYTPSNEEIADLQKLIEAIWPKIINMELPDISKYPADYTGIEQFQSDLLNKKI